MKGPRPATDRREWNAVVVAVRFRRTAIGARLPQIGSGA
jgi:hypothetical protein